MFRNFKMQNVAWNAFLCGNDLNIKAYLPIKYSEKNSIRVKNEFPYRKFIKQVIWRGDQYSKAIKILLCDGFKFDFKKAEVSHDDFFTGCCIILSLTKGTNESV